MRYGGNADVARAAALLAVITSGQGGYTVSRGDTDPRTGEQQYVLSTLLPQQGGAGGWVFTARELAHLARQTMTWFDWPYGDQGDKEERDEQGKVIRERREGHPGYVHPNQQDWRDAMVLTEETVAIVGRRQYSGSEWQTMDEAGQREAVGLAWQEADDGKRRAALQQLIAGADEKALSRTARKDWSSLDEELRKQILHSSLFILHFALPQGACSNITWHQYRSLQAIAPQLWQDGLTDEQARSLHAQFLAYILVPAPATADTGDRFHTRPSFRYDAERAEASVQFWEERLRVESLELRVESSDRNGSAGANCFQRLSSRLGHSSELDGSRCSGNSSLFTLHSSLILFHICFQVWQTAVANFYPSVFPLLFGGGKSDPLHTALTGETDTINAVMKYQGYSSPEQVYNTELPIILGTLNTMSKEAKEIEKMNAKIKRKG
jgi:hypothetical protein